MEQLAVNLFAIVLAGIVTLFIQRRLYVRRRRAPQAPGPEAAGFRSGRAGGSSQSKRRRRARPAGRGQPSGSLDRERRHRARGGIGVGAAELFGAANLGTALGVGQITFALRSSTCCCGGRRGRQIDPPAPSGIRSAASAAAPGRAGSGARTSGTEKVCLRVAPQLRHAGSCLTTAFITPSLGPPRLTLAEEHLGYPQIDRAVTLMLSADEEWIRTAAAALDQHRVVGGVGVGIRV